jgi:hypothetical protein
MPDRVVIKVGSGTAVPLVSYWPSVGAVLANSQKSDTAAVIREDEILNGL